MARSLFTFCAIFSPIFISLFFSIAKWAFQRDNVIALSAGRRVLSQLSAV
jgi:hypothetical protein